MGLEKSPHYFAYSADVRPVIVKQDVLERQDTSAAYPRSWRGLGVAATSDKGRKGVSLNEYLPTLRNAPRSHGFGLQRTEQHRA